jgi:hypothetical protein
MRIDSNKSLRTDFALCKVQVYGTITNHFVLFPDENHIAKSAIIPPQLTRDDRERLNDSTMAKDRVIASYIQHGHYTSTLSEEAMLRLLHEPFTYFGPAIGEHIVNRFPFSSEVGVTDHF